MFLTDDTQTRFFYSTNEVTFASKLETPLDVAITVYAFVLIKNSISANSD